MKKEFDDYIKKLKDDQYSRNRRNVDNIRNLIDKFYKEIESKKNEIIDDDEYD